MSAPEAAPSSWRVRAPYDGTPLGEVPVSSAAARELAISDAATLHRDRRGWLPPGERVELLRRAATLLEERAEAFALEAAREGGKPLQDSRIEVVRAIDGLRCGAETLRTQGGNVVPMRLNAASAHRLAFTSLEPVGPVMAISAFNHPLNNIVHQVVPAIAAGCPIVVKPAHSTPLTCLRFVALLREAGLPEAWCRVVTTPDDAATQALASDPRFSFLSFIGSAAVGWKLRAQAAPGTRVALEHGGAAPVLVAKDADLDETVPKLVKGAFYHAGQVCVSVQRIYAHAPVARLLAERIATAAEQLRVGDPTLATTDVGPLIRSSALQRVEEWVQEARTTGATVLSGGVRIGKNCYAPTVLFDPPEHARVSREEVFGPVVCIYPVKDLDEGVTRANAVPYAFQAAVFTRSLDTAMLAYRNLSASAVMVNDHTAFRTDWMPFAGLQQAGLGRGGIPFTCAEMQIEKLCVVRSPFL